MAARCFQIPQSSHHKTDARAALITTSLTGMAVPNPKEKIEREDADASLRDCVAEKTGNETLANLMYEGVRFRGSPYFYNWYRWEYDWGYGQQHRALGNEESALADLMLEEYFEQTSPGVCSI